MQSLLSISKDVLGSGLHDTSNAETHAHDIRELFDSNKVANKPIVLMETDGATVIFFVLLRLRTWNEIDFKVAFLFISVCQFDLGYSGFCTGNSYV